MVTGSLQPIQGIRSPPLMAEDQDMIFHLPGEEAIPSCPRCGSTRVRENGYIVGIEHIGGGTWKCSLDEISRDGLMDAICLEGHLEDGNGCEWEGKMEDLTRQKVYRVDVVKETVDHYEIRATSEAAAREMAKDLVTWERYIVKDYGGTWETQEPHVHGEPRAVVVYPCPRCSLTFEQEHQQISHWRQHLKPTLPVATVATAVTHQ